MTDMEAQALRDARHGFAAAADEIGVLGAMAPLPAEAIDRLIYAAACGFNASMQRQSACGGIPF